MARSRYKRTWQMKWAKTWTELQNAPWRECRAYSDAEAKAEMNRLSDEAGCPYAQLKAETLVETPK